MSQPKETKDETVELETKEQEVSTPYPWCHGSPTQEDCARRGYCNRDPNCGE